MSEINGVIAGNQSFAVMVGQSASFDQWVTAASLFLSLKAAGKQVVFAAPALPNLQRQPELKPLMGLEQVTQSLGKQNLVVGFPYTPEAVDSVSYAIDEVSNTFLLTIKPKVGSAPLAADAITTSYAGAAIEVLFLVGIHSWDQLGTVYASEPTVFNSAVRVAFHQFIPELSQMAFSPKHHTCLAEVVPGVLAEAELPLTPEVATNLLYGIEYQTDWLSSLRANAETFTTVATLLNAGAKRQSRPVLTPTTTASQTEKPQNSESKKPTKAVAKK